MFAAGLVIGGKSLAEEQGALARMNIVVCTPGRMLQHLSQTATFDVDSLRVLVLDEADRILDMGFQKELDAIVDYLPKDRQTMLFSATQTKKVSDLARLSLKDSAYVSVHEEATSATPKSLQQNYVISPLPEKLDTLWSFLQNAKKSKIIVFLSSGKQVRFAYEAFRHMQPGIPLLHLHGRQKQNTRLEINKRFTTATTSCLFATDVAARGLDFPAVDWVVQVDCPEDADTYIHRVGRTARYEREGRAILFLDPSEEEGMLKRLEAKKVPIEKVNAKQKKKTSIKNNLQNMCFKDSQLKYLGQKAFASYVRSIYVQKDKDIFQLDKLPLEEYAASLGLPGAPKIKFLKGDDAKARKNAPRVQLSDSESDLEESGDEEDAKTAPKKTAAVRTKYDRMFERKNQDILGEHRSKLLADENLDNSSAEEDDNNNNAGAFNGAPLPTDDFLTVKQRIPVDDDFDSDSDSDSDARPHNTHPSTISDKLVKVHGIAEPILVDSKRAEKRLQSKKKMLKYRDRGERLVFDDDGTARPVYELEDEEKFKARGEVEVQRQKFVDEEREKVAAHDVEDKRRVKERRLEKKIKRKQREKDEKAGAAAVKAGGENEEGDGQAVDLRQQFLDDTKGIDSSASEDEEEDRPRKKGKKWFERGSKQVDADDADGGDMDFEDLEKMAAGLIET
jgi:ATP-dependent RNA helicase DDX10/DBP4